MWRWTLVFSFVASVPWVGCTRTNRPEESSNPPRIREADGGSGSGGAGRDAVAGADGSGDAGRDAAAGQSGSGHAGRGAIAGQRGNGRAGSDAIAGQSGNAGSGGSQPGSCEGRCLDSDGNCRSLDEAWPAGDGCNTCTCNRILRSVSCSQIHCSPHPAPCETGECELDGQCHTPDLPVDLPECGTCTCRAGTWHCPNVCAADPDGCGCEQHGVCYPLGASTEDRCCECMENGFVCVEPGWCNFEPPNVGVRCTRSGGECARGLECYTEFRYERGICTRSCNYGCPTGTECVASIPHYLGGNVGQKCMRPCGPNVGDCPNGSECEALDDAGGPSYCF